MAKEEERMAALEAVKQAELRKRNLLHKLEIQTQVWLGGGMEGEAGGRGAIQAQVCPGRAPRGEGLEVST